MTNRKKQLALKPAGLLLVFAALSFAVAGCAMVRPVAEATRQYVLNPDSYEPRETQVVDEPLVLGIERVAVPRYLESPALPVREEGHRIRYSVDHRWAEPLGAGLTRLLRENLGREGLVGHVLVYPEGRYESSDLDIQVRVSRCEGAIEGERARGIFRASWEIRRGEDRVRVASGETRVDDLAWDGSDFSMLVAGLSEAANQTAADIAAELYRVAQ